MTATVPLPAGTTTLYAEVGGAGATHISTGYPAGQCFAGVCPFTFGGGAAALQGGVGGGASDVRTCSLSVPGARSASAPT